MVEIKYKKSVSNRLLYTALLFFCGFLIKIFLHKEVTTGDSIGLFPIVLFLSIYLYGRKCHYLIITKGKIIKNNFFYKEKVILKEIIKKDLVDYTCILKTSSKTLKIDLKIIDIQSVKQLYKELNKLDL